MLGASSSNQLGLPSTEDFNVLKEAFVELGSSVWARVCPIKDDPNGLYIKAEQLRADLDFLAWPLHTICLSGIVRAFPWGGSLVARYSEFSHSDTTKSSSVNHDYVLRTEFGELVEFGQSIRACPEIVAPATDIGIVASDEKLDQAAAGERILKRSMGNQLEITSGDCGVLYDRIAGFMT